MSPGETRGTLQKPPPRVQPGSLLFAHMFLWVWKFKDFFLVFSRNRNACHHILYNFATHSGYLVF